jgi:hypothetical protein
LDPPGCFLKLDVCNVLGSIKQVNTARPAKFRANRQLPGIGSKDFRDHRPKQRDEEYLTVRVGNEKRDCHLIEWLDIRCARFKGTEYYYATTWYQLQGMNIRIWDKFSDFGG